MHTPYLTTPISVDTLWHTNWGFCVRTILSGQATDFFLDHRLGWSHREYTQSFIDGTRKEHENTSNKTGTPNQLLSWVIAHVKARIIATWDDIPLDPREALLTVQKLWNARIERAKLEDRPGLEEYRDGLCQGIHQVIDGNLSSVIALKGIIWVLESLKNS